MMIAAATLWLVAKGQDPGLDLRQLAIQELRDPAPLELVSSDPARINDWTRQEAGVECNVPTRTGVRLTGAKVIRKGRTRIAAARANTSEDFGHGHALWQERGQAYAVSSSNPNRPDAGCFLCHAAL
jgi:hypothetical protein